MANDKRIQIQHWYTTGNTAPSGTGLTNMLLGEIAIATQTGEEAIFIKNNAGSAVTFMTSAQTYSLVEKATSGITTDGAFQMHREKTASVYSDENYNDIQKYGHVLLYNDDLNNKEVKTGVAAGMGHTHGQYQPKGDYLTGVTGDSGQPIVSLIENGVAKIGLTTGITNQINSGVSGYTRIEAHEPISANTEDIGHVKLVGGDLSGKTGNVIDGEAAASHHTHSQYFAKDNISNGLETWKKYDDSREMLKVKAADNGGITVNESGVSINSDLKDKWNNASSAITAFLDSNAAISGAVDTLREINEYLTGTGTSVETLLETLDDLTNTVSGNASDIASLTASASTNASEIVDLKNQQGNFVTSVIGSGNINARQFTDVGRQFIVTHTTAGTQTDEITATNYPTGLSFGSEFKIVNKIGYDANGHVVSGSTQTLKLPTVPTATTDNYGTVKIQHGDFGITYELLNTHSGIAADVNHFHSQYAKTSDLGMTINDNVTVISCGVY